ncbi:MAG: type II toxin-antitoxin system VapC family toxin [Chloroflexota bacterium]
MAREVFVDSGAWIALAVDRDQWHKSAVREYRELVDLKVLFITSNLVIAETYIMIRARGGHAAGMGFLLSVRSSPRVEVIRSDLAIELAAERILGQFDDQDFSFTDAVSFSVMHARQLSEAFAFDHHFAVAGFQMIPVMGV